MRNAQRALQTRSQDAVSNSVRPTAAQARALRDYQRVLGIAGPRARDNRHTYASLGAAAGLGLPILGALLGHKHPVTTARYAHLANDPLRAAADRESPGRSLVDAPLVPGVHTPAPHTKPLPAP